MVKFATFFFFYNPLCAFLIYLFKNSNSTLYKHLIIKSYFRSEHPFSDPLIVRNASSSLKRAIKEVDTAESENRHLRYGQLKRILNKLDVYI